jgi:hemoglobin
MWMRISVLILSMSMNFLAMAAEKTAAKPAAKPAAKAASKAETTPASTAAKKSLYDRLGGKDAITAVVGEFLNNVTADARINTFFKNTNAENLKTKLVSQICEATGGPCKYQGMDMKTAHTPANLKRASSGAHDKIGETEFAALVEDLSKALDKFNVPATEKTELLTALGGMKADILGGGKKQM